MSLASHDSYDYQQAVYVADVYLRNVDAKSNFYDLPDF